jgi:hypothetical protein
MESQEAAEELRRYADELDARATSEMAANADS